MPSTLGCRPISGFPPFRRLPPAQPHRKLRPEREKLTGNLHALLLFLITPTSAASQTAHCFFRHPSGQLCTESPHENPPAQPHRKPNREKGTSSLQKALMKIASTASQKTHMHCCLCFHKSRQHRLPESPVVLPAPARPALQKAHENPPAQPHRKPNPERDRLAENPHAVLLLILPGPRKVTAPLGDVLELKAVLYAQERPECAHANEHLLGVGIEGVRPRP